MNALEHDDTPDKGIKSEGPEIAMGDLSLKGQEFCPWKLVRSYPYIFAAKDDQEKVQNTFTSMLFENQIWDIFCLLDPSKRGRDPLLLVPSVQFKEHLKNVNSHLNLQLSVPEGEAGASFYATFGDRDTPLPRFLGRAGDLAAIEKLKLRIHRLPMDDLARLSATSLQDYRKKIDKLYESFKPAKNKAKTAEAARQKRMERQKGYGRMVKRAQRYLGLRGRLGYPPSLDIAAISWNADMPAPFPTEGSMRFISVDIEAWERQSDVITEVGLAILDTRDIVNIPPGKDGHDWFPLIKSRHLRIEEHKYKTNYRYVKGCPELFNFGDSEFVYSSEIGSAIATIIGDDESSDQRPVVMVGHAIGQDLTYLRKLGYNIWRVPQFTDEMDTMPMFQRSERSSNGRSLTALCESLGILGTNFHNAGNDATYTLQAMVAIAVRQMTDNPGEQKENNYDKQEEDEWSDGVMDDGGPAQKSAEWVPKPI
ncbi:hypothetical protein F5Y11DRAFT_190313 [Daldinia sp. FL1419]|nr:hypothetical protein F5Y11DRAFT_190313 [Daldinia sp. FL1419]